MIPRYMKEYLYDRLSETAITNRLKKDGTMCFLEFSRNDEHLLSRLGITIDRLGPRMVACVWDETPGPEIGGYVVVDNLSMGKPSMGGIRMLSDITPIDIHNLARGMTLKNGAANLPYGGGKSGIVSPKGLSPEEHTAVVRGFARLIRRYKEVYVPGPDVGTNDFDMKTVAIENGLDCAVSKPFEMGGNRIDELGAAAGGVVTALQTLLEIMPRLRVLPQFARLEIPDSKSLDVLFQGFGAVGAHAARILCERLPQAKTTGLSDLEGYLYDPNGLPVEKLYAMWKEQGLVTGMYYKEAILPVGHTHSTKYSTDANDLLRESAFCFVPAAAVFNYLGVLPTEKASMSVERMGNFKVIVEGANTYSPDPNKKAARIRMEQIVYRQKGVMIANDYLVNSGGVIFAAQEHMVPTPAHLQIPRGMLGNAKAVEKWMADHASEFAELSRKRLKAGESYREKVIHRNMVELVDLLAADIDLLPCAAAEWVSLQRMTAKEHERTIKDIMIPVQTIDITSRVQEAAARIVKEGNLVTVLDEKGKLAGVVTAWDITKAIAEGVYDDASLEKIVSRKVISASPSDRIPDVLRDLEQNQISAMPVVEDGKVLGLVTVDLMAHFYLMQVLQTQEM